MKLQDIRWSPDYIDIQCDCKTLNRLLDRSFEFNLTQQEEYGEVRVEFKCCGCGEEKEMILDLDAEITKADSL